MELSSQKFSRLNLESTKREQRLLMEPRHRAMSLGGQWFTSSTLSSSTPPSPLALPAPDDTHPLYKDWQMFNRWLKSEDDRLAQELEFARPSRSSWGDNPRSEFEGNGETAAVLYHLRREVEDAIIFEENRSKRAAMEKRSHLGPSDAIRQQVRDMPQAPPRTYTLESGVSENFLGFSPARNSVDGSVANNQPDLTTLSLKTSPLSIPRPDQDRLHSFDCATHAAHPEMIHSTLRSSISTIGSNISVSPEPCLAPSPGLSIDTAETTPDDAFSNMLHRVLSTASIGSLALGESALQWASLVRKVKVERKSSERWNGKERFNFETQECDIHWRYREDAGITLRASYRSNKDGKPRIWTVQDFPTTGPSIPLTTTIDDEVSIDFPRGSFGRLDKQWTDIKYTFTDSTASFNFQTLLYTNNGKNAAELLFDRPIITISSDKHKPECRGRNLRLWRRSEMVIAPDEPLWSDVLVLLFYTTCLEEKGHWVEEPHYAFEWFSESSFKKDSDKLTLTFSKDPTRWSTDKVFSRRRLSRSTTGDAASVCANIKNRKDSMELPSIKLSGSSSASSAATVRPQSLFGKGTAPSRGGNVNCFQYKRLDIEFQNKKDRREFTEIWRRFVKPIDFVG